MNIDKYFEGFNLNKHVSPYSKYEEILSKDISIDKIKGLIPLSVTPLSYDDHAGFEAIAFEFDDKIVMLHHWSDCCESVWIESIVGDLQDLVGNPLLMVEESVGDYDQADGSGTWTFYKFATIKGYVDIRFIGESNGYYSENVDITEYYKV